MKTKLLRQYRIQASRDVYIRKHMGKYEVLKVLPLCDDQAIEISKGEFQDLEEAISYREKLCRKRVYEMKASKRLEINERLENMICLLKAVWITIIIFCVAFVIGAIIAKFPDVMPWILLGCVILMSIIFIYRILKNKEDKQ